MAINISKMDIEALLALRSQVDEALSRNQRALENQLQRMRVANGGIKHRGRRGGRSALKGRKVEVKYRHPETGETYAGRGAMAGWLKAELKAGKKLEDFLVDKLSVKTARKAARKKPRRKGAKR
jgi:DNA-binding protein H-NS